MHTGELLPSTARVSHGGFHREDEEQSSGGGTHDRNRGHKHCTRTCHHRRTLPGDNSVAHKAGASISCVPEASSHSTPRSTSQFLLVWKKCKKNHPHPLSAIQAVVKRRLEPTKGMSSMCSTVRSSSVQTRRGLFERILGTLTSCFTPKQECRRSAHQSSPRTWRSLSESRSRALPQAAQPQHSPAERSAGPPTLDEECTPITCTTSSGTSSAVRCKMRRWTLMMFSYSKLEALQHSKKRKKLRKPRGNEFVNSTSN